MSPTAWRVRAAIGRATELNLHLEVETTLERAEARLESGDVDVVLLSLSTSRQRRIATLHGLTYGSPDHRVVRPGQRRGRPRLSSRAGAEDHLVKAATSTRDSISRSIRFAAEHHRLERAMESLVTVDARPACTTGADSRPSPSTTSAWPPARRSR